MDSRFHGNDKKVTVWFCKSQNLLKSNGFSFGLLTFAVNEKKPSHSKLNNGIGGIVSNTNSIF